MSPQAVSVISRWAWRDVTVKVSTGIGQGRIFGTIRGNETLRLATGAYYVQKL
jgi:hypothetical protein